MNEAIPRSAYPDTRDEQAMKRFMAGTLNVGHHLTFQRKGQIVNVSPQGTERELLNRYFEQSEIHKNDRCVNVRLHLHPNPIDPDLRLSRDPEFNVYPYIHAKVSLTPAEGISVKGTKRNMHMQTHNVLPNAPTFWVYGVGHRKGELTLLQFVKDTITFKTDLERDEMEEAARRGRPFITPWPADTAEQMLNLPQDTSMNIRELFETGSELASTQSDVASQARRTATMAQQRHGQIYHAQQHQQQQHIAPGSVLLDGQQSGYHALQPTSSNWQCFPALLNSNFNPAPGENAESSPANQQGSALLSEREEQGETRPHLTGPTLSPLQATVQAGMQAAKIIFPLRSGSHESRDSSAPPSLPDARYFLDLVRCRLVLRDANLPAHEIFSSWQSSHNTARRMADCEANDSGVTFRDAQTRNSDDQASQTNRLTSADASGSTECDGHGMHDEQAVKASTMTYDDYEWAQSAWQMISPDRTIRGLPHRRSSSNATRQSASRARKGKARSESDKIDDASSAASALLALSPTKRADSLQS